MTSLALPSDMTNGVAAVIVAGSIVLGTLALRTEMARPARRTSGIVAALLLALSTLWLGLQPERSVTGRGIAVLVTPGASPTDVRRLLSRLGPAELLSLDADVPGATRITDLGDLSRRRPGLDTLHVAGWGPSRAEWAAAADWQVVRHPAPVPDGIVAMSAPGHTALGQQLEVRGTVHRHGKPAWIHLDGPSGPVDSLRLADSPDAAFTLAATPRDTGSWQYALRLSEDTAGVLGVAVTPPRPLSVLILEAAPSFEASHFAHWLARRGARIARWTETSRGRVQTAFVNVVPRTLRPLSTTALAGVDLVVADATVLDHLRSTERAALEAAIAGGGAGLLVRPDDDRSPALRRWFAPVAFGPDDRLVRPRWTDASSGRTAVPAEPLALGDRFGTVTVMSDESGAAIAQAAPVGRGRVTLSLVRAPSRWLLAGDSVRFAEYWTAVVSATAPGVAPAWHIGGAARVDAPLALTLAGDAPDSVARITANVTVESLPLTRAGDSLRRTVTYWPREPGWHTVEAGGATATFYVQPTGAWPARDAADRLAATAERAAWRRPPIPTGEPPHLPSAPPVPRPIGLVLPFLVWLGSAAYLWSRDAAR